jgi:hypothetical protein
MEQELIVVLVYQLALMELKNYIINTMTKVKMYCPKTMGTFKMMFGFAQPLNYTKHFKPKLKKQNNDKKL